VVGAGGIGVALLVGIATHVSDLRSTTLVAAQRRLVAGAAGTARMVDTWMAERNDDARSLAEAAGIPATDASDVSPPIASRLVRLEMEELRRRGHYTAIWIVDSTGRVVGSVGDRRLNEDEADAAARAIATRAVALSTPAARDSTVTVGIAHPMFSSGVAGPRAPAAAVFRADLNHGFAPAAPAERPESAPVIVVPKNGRALGISLCPAAAYAAICLAPVVDTLARLALAAPNTFGPIALRGGSRVLVATHRIAALPWRVYFAGDEQAQFAPMRERLRFESLVFIGILLIVALGLYAYDRAVHLRQVTERAQTEARFAGIVNTAMDAIIIANETYEIAALNRAAETMFGYDAVAAPGRSVLELIPQTEADQLLRTFEHVLRASSDQAAVLRSDRYVAGRRRDGTTFPMNVSVSRTQIDDRPHLTIVVRDVTDWKRAEETSEWQRAVLEAVATGVELRHVLASIARFPEAQCPGIECAIHLIDDDGVTLRAVCAPSMSPECVAAMDEIVIGPRAAACGTAAYRREPVVTTDIATDILWNDYRALAAERGYRASWASPIVSPQGRLLGALALYAREARGPTAAERLVAESATQLAGLAVDRAHAAASLRQSEASFRSFVENSPIGIYRATSSGRLLAVNASLVELLGYDSPAELLQIDMTAHLFVSVADRERLFRQLETQGELRSAEMEWRRKDDTTLTVRVSARAYHDDRGLLWASEGFVENVTPLRAAEQALRQSEKLAALGQLVSGVAHELNNPLAAILHFAEDLLDDERTAEDLEALSVIRDQARRSRAIVRDLLSFVRFRNASRERVKLTEALTTSVRALQPVVADIGATLTADLPASEIVGNTDRAGLQQIVTNLVINAAQASGNGGIVGLRAKLTRNELTIIVEDSGPGIPAAVMDRIFEPFFTTKPVGEGTGLGLSVTLGIVQQLGGRISAENRSPAEGGGARFTVVLPVERAGMLELAEAGPTPASGDGGTLTRGPRVLIIDDEASIRAALKRFFSRRGWRVEEAADGADGLSALLVAKSDFAVIVSDLKMPGCSGMELHDHVAGVAPELLDRIIFSTGDVASRDAAEFVRRTRCTVLQKPFELRALETLVNRMRQKASA
jgi:PAS domain S-box-containing protein